MYFAEGVGERIQENAEFIRKMFGRHHSILPKRRQKESGVYHNVHAVETANYLFSSWVS
jgi:hypothetical protein